MLRDEGLENGVREWRGKEFAFFTHRKCELFPCHETADTEDFNCLFCYCPLYMLGEKCGGNYRYLPNGVKACTYCIKPHIKENYGDITSRFDDITRSMKTNKEGS